MASLRSHKVVYLDPLQGWACKRFAEDTRQKIGRGIWEKGSSAPNPRMRRAPAGIVVAYDRNFPFLKPSNNRTPLIPSKDRFPARICRRSMLSGTLLMFRIPPHGEYRHPSETLQALPCKRITGMSGSLSAYTMPGGSAGYHIMKGMFRGKRNSQMVQRSQRVRIHQA
jgi:hypothetical protein